MLLKINDWPKTHLKSVEDFAMRRQRLCLAYSRQSSGFSRPLNPLSAAAIPGMPIAGREPGCYTAGWVKQQVS
jgi:hypothetical protein